jgi:hypothetical protein
MSDIFTYVSLVVLGSFLLGLMFYSFYRVLTSKDPVPPAEFPQKIGQKTKKK